MNLRTITCWAAYDPKRRVIVSLKRYRKLLDNGTFPDCIMVKMKGHYVLPRPSTREKR